jgi:hypothetical protein
MHRDIKGLDACLLSNRQLQGMQDLGQDQGHPQLDQDQFLAGSPPQCQTHLAFERFKSQFDIPSAPLELSDLQ